MDPDLEALKRQRDLVAQHLAWLDGEIQRQSASPSKGVSAPAPRLRGTAETYPSPSHAGQVPLSGRFTGALEPDPELLTAAPQRGLAPSQRVGCVAFALLFAALSVFLIWVLPNWLYD